MRERTWFLVAGIGSAAWTFLVSWLARDVSCAIDGCGEYALLLIVGLAAILLVSTIGLARKIDRLAWESLATLATSFTAPGVLAMMAFLYLTDSEPIQTTIGGLFLLFIGVPTIFAVCILSRSQFESFGLGRTHRSRLSTRSTTAKESSVATSTSTSLRNLEEHAQRRA